MPSSLDLLGYIAAVLTTVGFIPQAIKIIRSRETHAISLWLYLTFTSGVALWFIYGVELHAWPIILANGLTFLLAFTILVLKIRYG